VRSAPAAPTRPNVHAVLEASQSAADLRAATEGWPAEMIAELRAAGEETGTPPDMLDSVCGPTWPKPEPVPSTLSPVEPFNWLLLPDKLRAWVEDISDRMQCPPDFVAVAVMVALGSIVGRQLGIRPKAFDDWTVVPNLWGVVVGRPGVLKTPAVAEALKPLRGLEVEARAKHEDAVREWEAEAEVRAVEKKVRADHLKRELKKPGADRTALAQGLVTGEPDEPQRRRYVVNDTTVEKLGEILAGNPNGVLLYRDELTGFLRGLDRDGRESDRAFYLEAWNGDGRFTYDRIGRGTVDIEAACVSVLGTTQPGPLREYVRSMRDGRGGDDGLLQRFQLAVWPDVSTGWENVDRRPDRAAAEVARALFDGLARLDPTPLGAETDGEGGLPFLRFDPSAQVMFDEWRSGLERRVRSAEEHPALESHLAKYRSLVPALALLIHLAGEGCGPVKEEALATAILWVEYLEIHARRLYAPVIGTDAAPAAALAKHLRKGDLEDSFTRRDVERKGWSGLRKEDVERATDTLEDLGWIRAEEDEPGDRGGRPTVRYRINPLVREGSA